MNIKFEDIQIENFRSIEKAHINLQNQGNVIVKGVNEYEDNATSNGSGKSSIFEAIVYALFEETSSGEKDVANRINNKGFIINLNLNIDGMINKSRGAIAYSIFDFDSLYGKNEQIIKDVTALDFVINVRIVRES